jgi:hypothetical protein
MIEAGPASTSPAFRLNDVRRRRHQVHHMTLGSTVPGGSAQRISTSIRPFLLIGFGMVTWKDLELNNEYFPVTGRDISYSTVDNFLDFL